MQNICKGIELRENEYIKDDMIYCKTCNEPKILDMAECGDLNHFPFSRYVRTTCKCDEERRLKEEQQKLIEQDEQYYKTLLQNSLLGELYQNVKFENTDLEVDESFIKAFNTCKKYVENYERVLKDGKGLYLYGTSGSGKTHLMACMVNYLLKKQKACLITNLYEISKEIRKTFNGGGMSESDFLNRLTNIPFLFIDDIGTERLQVNGEDTFIQERLYDVINTRYLKMKPTIFSSNLNLVDLIAQKGMWQKTVDRINGMIYKKVEVNGKSYRAKNIDSSFLD